MRRRSKSASVERRPLLSEIQFPRNEQLSSSTYGVRNPSKPLQSLDHRITESLSRPVTSTSRIGENSWSLGSRRHGDRFSSTSISSAETLVDTLNRKHQHDIEILSSLTNKMRENEGKTRRTSRSEYLLSQSMANMSISGRWRNEASEMNSSVKNSNLERSRKNDDLELDDLSLWDEASLQQEKQKSESEQSQYQSTRMSKIQIRVAEEIHRLLHEPGAFDDLCHRVDSYQIQDQPFNTSGAPGQKEKNGDQKRPASAVSFRSYRKEMVFHVPELKKEVKHKRLLSAPSKREKLQREEYKRILSDAEEHDQRREHADEYRRQAPERLENRRRQMYWVSFCSTITRLRVFIKETLKQREIRNHHETIKLAVQVIERKFYPYAAVHRKQRIRGLSKVILRNSLSIAIGRRIHRKRHAITSIRLFFAGLAKQSQILRCLRIFHQRVVLVQDFSRSVAKISLARKSLLRRQIYRVIEIVFLFLSDTHYFSLAKRNELLTKSEPFRIPNHSSNEDQDLDENNSGMESCSSKTSSPQVRLHPSVQLLPCSNNSDLGIFAAGIATQAAQKCLTSSNEWKLIRAQFFSLFPSPFGSSPPKISLIPVPQTLTTNLCDDLIVAHVHRARSTYKENLKRFASEQHHYEEEKKKHQYRMMYLERLRNEDVVPSERVDELESELLVVSSALHKHPFLRVLLTEEELLECWERVLFVCVSFNALFKSWEVPPFLRLFGISSFPTLSSLVESTVENIFQRDINS